MTKENLIALLRDPVQTAYAVDELHGLIEKYPYFHTAHQLYLKGLQQTDESKMKLQLKKSAFYVRDRTVLYNYINDKSENQLLEMIQRRLAQIEAKKEEKNETTENLIDNFLKSNPKIIPNDECTFQVDLSESMNESPEIVSETLADIYAAQGHKNKAIEIYQKLVLQYPEKHIYFAAQIERLKR